METPERNSINFVKPNLEHEMGEIERVAELFANDDKEKFARKIVEEIESAEPQELSEDEWGLLENTDSYDIEVGDWSKVALLSEMQEVKRDWQGLRSKMEKEECIEAPVILKIAGKLHLVSGNTRLMVARALGLTPKVIIVSMGI